jgi:RNA polymerase sigma-70 factor (ECF subfamily)
LKRTNSIALLTGLGPALEKAAVRGPDRRAVLREPKRITSDSLPLGEAIRLANRGDSAAFEVIYRLHSRLVYSICLRMLRDPFEAEDLTQETFVLLLRKIHTFRGESAFSSWLHKLTTNLVLMRFRKKMPPSTSLDEISANTENSEPRNEIGAPDLNLSGLFDRINLQAAIDLLPAGCKTTFILHDVEGYEHKEIAGILGCSVGNSKSQLHRARKRLRKLLGEAPHRPPQKHIATGESLVLAASY